MSSIRIKAVLVAPVDQIHQSRSESRSRAFSITGNSLVMGDYDRSGEVNLADFAGFQTCFTAGGSTDVSPCCRIFDFEPDGDVDLLDFRRMLVAAGPWTIPPAPDE